MLRSCKLLNAIHLEVPEPIGGHMKELLTLRFLTGLATGFASAETVRCDVFDLESN